MSRRTKSVRFQLEGLEARLALSDFGQTVAAQAQDVSILDYSLKNFGQWQCEHAQDGGLGQYNNANDGSSKGKN
jgi:hypothetical protein